MTKFVRYFITLGLLLASNLLPAQDFKNPVSWASSLEQIDEEQYKIIFTATLEPGWNMYDLSDYGEFGPTSTSFSFNPSDSYSLVGSIQALSAKTEKKDPSFGMDIGYYSQQAIFSQDIRLKKKGTIVSGEIEWMACNDSSCIAPEQEEFSINIGNVSAEANPQTAGINITTTDNTIPKSFWMTIIEAILWGFAALLTPCVFPMIPMTVSFFMKNEGTPSRGRFMAMMYGFFIVCLYTLPIAVIILVTRVLGGDSITADIFNWLATHWIPNVLFFIIFMLFAASFFGAFEITLPSWLINKSDSKSASGGLVGILFMAMTLVFVSFSCTGPIVGSVLIKSTAGQFWEPIATMLAFSVAFSLPFSIFALFPSLLKKLPRSGGWLSSVKIVLGFIEIALGLKFLSIADQTYHWGLLDREVYLAIWIVVFGLLGMYLIGKLHFKNEQKSEGVGVTRLFLAIIVFSFTVYMIPGMFGAPLKGISGYLPPLHTQDFNVSASKNSSSTNSNIMENRKYSDFLSIRDGLDAFFSLDEGLAYAKTQNKPVLIYFTGHGCVNCREMYSKVWADAQVHDILSKDYIIIALYTDDKKTVPETDWITTHNGRTLKSLGKINSYLSTQRYKINSQPSYLITNSQGEALLPVRGYNLNINSYLDFLNEGLKAYKDAN